MLEINKITTGYYDGPDVLHEADVLVNAGEVVALIGLNGAGKSTLVKSAAGLIPVRSGSVIFNGVDITTTATNMRAKRGMMLVPEGRELFSSMSVADTLRIGLNPVPRSARSSVAKSSYQRVYELFPVLEKRQNQAAGTLSGGEQQMLAIGRALMSEPSFLILDEPSLGLAPKLIEEIFQVLKKLNSEGMSILLVEQNAVLALDISHRAYVLELGKITQHEDSKILAQSTEWADLVSGGSEDAIDVKKLTEQVAIENQDPSRRLPEYTGSDGNPLKFKG